MQAQFFQWIENIKRSKGKRVEPQGRPSPSQTLLPRSHPEELGYLKRVQFILNSLILHHDCRHLLAVRDSYCSRNRKAQF